MVPVAVAVLFAVGCGDSSTVASEPSSSAEPVTSTVQSSTTELATTTTTVATTTVAPTATESEREVSDAYCALSRQSSLDTAQYLIDNGAESNTSIEFAELSVSTISKADRIPEAIAEELALVRETLVAYRDALAASGVPLTNDELLEVWTPEAQAAAAAISGYDAETCGFTEDSIAEELRAAIAAESPTTIEGSVRFVDPDGAYTWEVDPSWPTAHDSIAEGIEVWIVGEPVDGSTPNVNVMTQVIPPMTLSEYLQVSVDSLPRLDPDAILFDSGVLNGGAQEIAYVDYLADFGNGQIRFLGYFTVLNDRAVVLTLATDPELTDEIRVDVVPFMSTLVQTVPN